MLTICISSRKTNDSSGVAGVESFAYYYRFCLFSVAARDRRASCKGVYAARDAKFVVFTDGRYIYFYRKKTVAKAFRLSLAFRLVYLCTTYMLLRVCL